MCRGDGRPVCVDGGYYTVAGAPAGPAPAHPIEIWTGAQGPRALAQAGRIADGWAALIASYLPYEQWARANRYIDDGARSVGRHPADLRRIAQIVGSIDASVRSEGLSEGAEPLRAGVQGWVAEIVRLAREQPFTGFVFWPEHETTEQITLFAREVAPVARALIAAQSYYGDRG
jgi:alkanesulfonate monooxygenase SsuD/methylene tetrahydromethanopterin reductase-like flavin-dependent oxidoreductase (luciferase family)